MTVSGPRRVAAFDFDGTLTPRDTLIPFLERLYGRRRLAAAAASVGPPWRPDPGVHRRDAAKAQLLRRLTAGDDAARVTEAGEAYASRLNGLLVPTMVDRIGQHRRAGHEIVAVSASLATYLVPLLQRRHDFDQVLAVGLAVDDDGRHTGEMLGPNVRGPEKAVVLRRWLAATGGHDDGLELWAYGNSSGDAELLAMADHPTLMDGRKPPTFAPLA